MLAAAPRSCAPAWTWAARSRASTGSASARDFMPWIFSEADLATMAAVKAVFNPTGRCNPGKVFPTRKSCAPGEIAYHPHPLEASGLIQRL